MTVTRFSKQIVVFLDWCVEILSRSGLKTDFIRFGLVGAIGFCWDTLTVYTLRSSLGLYAAGTIGFLIAATANWMLNRIWTFRDRNHQSAHRQWAKFMAANAIGFIFNRGTFFILISISPLCRAEPVLPILAGSFAGLSFNYCLSKMFVFN